MMNQPPLQTFGNYVQKNPQAMNFQPIEAVQPNNMAPSVATPEVPQPGLVPTTQRLQQTNLAQRRY